MSLPEIVALLVSVDLLGAGGAGPSGPAAAAALAKIRALLTPRALELVDRMRAGVGARTIGAKVQLVSGGLYLVGYCHLRREVRVFAVERLERDETRWITWERYSGRQDRRMEWAGVVGAVTYRGDLKPFWPYLVFGQWTHAGSGTTFGLSGYRIEP